MTPESDTDNPLDSSTDGLGLGTATELMALLEHGMVSARELLDHYRQRVEVLNPAVNALITFDWERAEAEAKAVDDARADGQAVGPLAGLPISIKDAITTEGMASTGGAQELADNVPDTDAPVVDALRAAGAIVFAKSNLPRWSGDVQAYNPMFGVTNNPWDLTRTPGGSSGGAAAAVAAGMSGFDIGTDIGGSVRLPAHFSGVCGHKPSHGVVPQLGYLDYPTAGVTEADVNVFGPLARSVDDLTLVFDVVAGPPPDRAVGWRLDLPPGRHATANGGIDVNALRVAAWLDDPVAPVASVMRPVLEGAAEALAGVGARVDYHARPDVGLDQTWQVGVPLISAATSPSLSAEVFADQVARAEAKARQQTGGVALPTGRSASSTGATSPAGHPASSATSTAATPSANVMRHRDWLALNETRQRHRALWAEFFTHHDVLLCPVAVTPAIAHQHQGNFLTRSVTIDGIERPYAELIAWTSFIGYVYLPSTVVPVGLTDDGLPVGIQVVAPYLEDRTALSVAKLLEELLGGYQVPPIAVRA